MRRLVVRHILTGFLRPGCLIRRRIVAQIIPFDRSKFSDLIVCNELIFGYVTEPSRSDDPEVTEKRPLGFQTCMGFVNSGLDLGERCDKQRCPERVHEIQNMKGYRILVVPPKAPGLKQVTSRQSRRGFTPRPAVE